MSRVGLRSNDPGISRLREAPSPGGVAQVTQVAFYSVCTECSFMRVYGESAAEHARVDVCPECGGDVVTQEKVERFEPAYMGRVTSALYGTSA